MHCVGVDVFIVIDKYNETIIEKFKNLSGFNLTALSNRGTRVWPGHRPRFDLTDLFRARYFAEDGKSEVSGKNIVNLLTELNSLNMNWVHVEKLHRDKTKNLFSEIQ